MRKNTPREIIASAKRMLTCPPCRQTDTHSELYVQKENLEIISCSNIVLHVRTGYVEGFLSECRMHQPIWKYVDRFVDDYFACFRQDDDDAATDRAVIRKTLENPANFDKFVLIGKHSAYSDSPYRRYLKMDDGGEVGLDLSNTDVAQKTRIRHFTERYVWPQLTAYYANSDAKAGTYHCRTTAKVLATETIAKLIGLEETIPHAKYTKLIVTDAGNRVIFGNFMEKAHGICAMDIPGQCRREMITPAFQRAMLNMNLLDVICHEQDHSPNNYNVVTGEAGQLIGISVYDNNGLGTFPLSSGIDYETYKKCSSFLREDGTVNRSCLDRTAAEAVLALTPKQVNHVLSPYLSKPVIWYTWRRIAALQRAIKASISRTPYFLLNADAFSEKTIEDELSGRYGKTYLVSFLQDCLQREQYR